MNENLDSHFLIVIVLEKYKDVLLILNLVGPVK